MRKTRILVIENSTAITGALISALRSGVELTSSFDFVFILPSGSTATPTVREAGFEVYELPLREVRKSIISLITYLPFLIYNSIRIHRLVKFLKIDLINVNDFYNLVPIGYKLLGGAVPYVCYVRFLPAKFPSTLVRLWLALHEKYAHSIIAVSEAVKKEMPSSEKTIVISNELPNQPSEYFPSTSSIILYPGNYIQGKGQNFAIECFARICRSIPGWRMRFVGGTMGLQKNQDYKTLLMKRTEELGLQNQVEWLDFASDLKTYYHDAAIVLNFSESESFSMTCLEAMYYGRPVVATKCGGPSEIIDNEDTGLLVELRDIASMSAALKYLITHPQEREAMGRSAYSSVRMKFSYQNTVGKLKEVYDSALSKQSFNGR